MDTLSSAVAEVVRRELAGRRIDAADFAKTVGMPKTTVWRKVNGTSKMSIDDAMAFARGLGWELPELVSRAEARQGDGADPLEPRSGAGKRVLAEERAVRKLVKRTGKARRSTG